MFFTFLTLFTFRRDSARTLFGWTPGLQAILRSRQLQCGCLTGTYQTRAGDVAEIIDARGSACTDAAHAPDTVLHRSARGRLLNRQPLDEVASSAWNG